MPAPPRRGQGLSRLIVGFAALGLSIVFGTAALAKGHAAQELIVAVSAGLGFSLSTSWLIVLGVTIVEWGLAVWLIDGRRRISAFAFSLVLLVAFTFFQVRLSASGSPSPCGCGPIAGLLGKATGDDALRSALWKNSAFGGLAMLGLVGSVRRPRDEASSKKGIVS